jgi:predicted MFS family arabinose efflux permease
MPGVKAITDRAAPEQRGRATSIYVSSFATTTSFSIIIAGLIADAFTWRAAFILPAVTNGLAFLLILLALPPAKPELGEGPRRAVFDFSLELRDPRIVGFVIAGTMHTLELLAARGWTVVMLVVVSERWPWLDDYTILAIATFLVLIGVPCSMIGGEIGYRRGFAYAAALAMALSALACGMVGFAMQWPLWLFVLVVLLHNVFILADSGALNGGAAQAALPGRRGAAITLMAFSNALGSLIGPVLFGFMLDLGGGRDEPFAWGFAFMGVSLCVIFGVAALNRGIAVARS